MSAGLRDLAAAQGVTLNSVAQSLWALLLSRYNSATDVVFGAITSGRPPELRGVEEAVGLFITAIPVRVRIEAEQPFAELSRQLQEQSIAGEPHQHLPLPEIQAASPLGRELFDHLVIFENYPVARELNQSASRELVIETLSAHDLTHYAFNLIIVPSDDISLRVSYDANRYADDQVRRMVEHFCTAARSAIRAPGEPVKRIEILPEWEQRLVVDAFNAGGDGSFGGGTVLNRFATQVGKEPERVAVRFAGNTLTYRELEERANRLANYLQCEHGVAAEECVGLLIDRSELLPAAVLGILKAGAAYLPIDPDYPAERIRYLVEDAGCRVILSENRHLPKLPGACARIVELRDALDGAPDEPQCEPAPWSLAYVIYTSGSTGKPKGCQVEHRNLVQYLDWASRFYFEGDEGGAFGLYSSLAFDLTVTSLFLPLIRGKALTIFSQDAELSDIFATMFGPGSGIDSVKLTPSHIALVEQLGAMRTCVRLAIVGGEALPLDQVRLLHALNPAMKVYNEYGPTETTVGCAVKRIEPSDERVLIGRPIDGAQIYILDELGMLAPIGVPGEIFIGGAGVARGYLGRPDLTAERFLENPFWPGERVYRTSDIGLWLPDGNIDYLGRNDQQVKIRGHRVELGEIEDVLLRQAGVREAAVVVRSRDSALVAYVAGDGALDVEAIRVRIACVLPGYMVPAQFVRLDNLPLSPYGKIDRKALPEPGATSRAAHTAPRTGSEERLLRVWREVLEVAEIGIDDNFFELGGHSLKAMQVSSRIHRELGIRIRLRDFMERPTIAALAARVDGAERAGFCAIEPAPEEEHYELSHAQQRLWLLHQMGGASAYNMPHALLFDVPLDLDALRRAFVTIIERHEALRTAFVLVNGEPRQKVCREVAFALREVDLRAEPDPEASARQLAAQEAPAPFDLTQPPLLRATVARLDAQRSLFLLTIHHIVGDGWSGNVLYREVLSLFDAYRRGEPDPLTPLRIQYKDFAVWQNRQRFEHEERYWLAKLDGAPERLELPYDFAPGEERGFQGDFEAVTLDLGILRSFRAIATARSTTVSNVVLAIFKLLLFQLAKQRDFCVGMSVANRNHPDLENILGFFVNVLPIRTQLSEDMDFEALLRQVTQSTTEALGPSGLSVRLARAEAEPAAARESAADRERDLRIPKLRGRACRYRLPRPRGRGARVQRERARAGADVRRILQDVQVRPHALRVRAARRHRSDDGVRHRAVPAGVDSPLSLGL